MRDQAADGGQDASDLEELTAELDGEITNAGMRGNVLRPGRCGGTVRPGAVRTLPRCRAGIAARTVQLPVKIGSHLAPKIGHGRRGRRDRSNPASRLTCENSGWS